MATLCFSQFFPGARWRRYIQMVCRRLVRETLLITALPDVGITFFVKAVEENYHKINKNKDIVVIFHEVIPEEGSIFHLASSIMEQTNHKLNYPSYLGDRSCQGMIKEILKKGKELMVIIHHFERLEGKNETMAFLNSLRGINSLKIRFLISCGIDCLVKAGRYASAVMLTSANITFLPTFQKEEIRSLLKVYKAVYRWKVPLYFAEDIFRLSGGFVGFIKYIAKYIDEQRVGELNPSKLALYPGLRFKIDNLIKTLSEHRLLQNGYFNMNHLELLQKVGVLDARKRLRIGILETAIDKTDLTLEPSQLITMLTKQEIALYEKLKQAQGNIVSLDELSEALWREKSGEKYSLWAIYKTLSNLNKKLHTIGMETKNYRGRGYLLVKK